MQSFEQIILLLVTGQGILLTLALLSSIVKKNYSNFFLGLITLVITIEILNIWGMRVSYHNSENAFPFWLLGSYLILPPALWLFVKVNTQPFFQPKTIHFFFFLPALIEIVVEFFSFYSNRFLTTQYRLLENELWYIFTEVVPIVAMAVVLAFFAKALMDLRTRLKNISQSKSNYYQISKLFLFFAVFSFLTLFWFLLTLFDAEVFNIIETILIIFLFVLGYLGYFQPTFFDIPKVLKKEIIKEKFPQYDDKVELNRLNNLFTDKKIYTKQKLTVNEVASHLELPKRYVSGIINSYHNVNFTQYVNSFRVAEVLKRIKDPKESNKTLLGIALESGFNSKSSFNQIFKDTTGKNPSDFLKK